MVCWVVSRRNINIGVALGSWMPVLVLLRERALRNHQSSPSSTSYDQPETHFSPATSAMLRPQPKDWQMRAPRNLGGSPNRRSQQKQATGMRSAHFQRQDISWRHAMRERITNCYRLSYKRLKGVIMASEGLATLLYNLPTVSFAAFLFTYLRSPIAFLLIDIPQPY